MTKIAKRNKEHLKEVCNNEDFEISHPNNINNNLIHLQVKGKNQLNKEIEEMFRLKDKYIDQDALHRNDNSIINWKHVEIEG